MDTLKMREMMLMDLKNKLQDCFKEAPDGCDIFEEYAKVILPILGDHYSEGFRRGRIYSAPSGVMGNNE